MGKRFTDNEKWKRRWFSELEPMAKLVWFYICDECDNAGIWYSNWKRISSDIGIPITPEIFENWFQGKFEKHEDRYFFRSFVDFQYGELNPQNNAHKSVILKLSRLSGAAQVLMSPSRGAQDKDTAKDKEKDKEGECEGAPEKPPAQNLPYRFDSVLNDYGYVNTGLLIFAKQIFIRYPTEEIFREWIEGILQSPAIKDKSRSAQIRYFEISFKREIGILPAVANVR